MNEKWIEEIKHNDEMTMLDRYFPGKSCGNAECERLCIGACAMAKKLNVSPNGLVDYAIQQEIVPRHACKKAMLLADYPNSQNYPNKGKTIPGCRFGYTYGSHPDKSDEQLAANKKTSKKATTPSWWEKTKEHISNVLQATKIVVETKYAPPGSTEIAGGVQAVAEIQNDIRIQASYTKALARQLEKEAGEDMTETYMQIQDCLSKEDIKRLFTIQSKLKKRLKELGKKQK